METLVLKIQGFEIQGKEGTLRLELFFKGKHGLDPQHYQGRQITIVPVLGVPCTLVGEILCTPWPQELSVVIWPRDEQDLRLRLLSLMDLLLPGLTNRVLVTLRMEKEWMEEKP